jgi:hypothetical protein
MPRWTYLGIAVGKGDVQLRQQPTWTTPCGQPVVKLWPVHHSHRRAVVAGAQPPKICRVLTVQNSQRHRNALVHIHIARSAKYVVRSRAYFEGRGYTVPGYQFVLRSAPCRNGIFPKIACGPYFWQRPGTAWPRAVFPLGFFRAARIVWKGGPVRNTKATKNYRTKNIWTLPIDPKPSSSPSSSSSRRHSSPMSWELLDLDFTQKIHV